MLQLLSAYSTCLHQHSQHVSAPALNHRTWRYALDYIGNMHCMHSVAAHSVQAFWGKQTDCTRLVTVHTATMPRSRVAICNKKLWEPCVPFVDSSAACPAIRALQCSGVDKSPHVCRYENLGLSGRLVPLPHVPSTLLHVRLRQAFKSCQAFKICKNQTCLPETIFRHVQHNPPA